MYFGCPNPLNLVEACEVTQSTRNIHRELVSASHKQQNQEFKDFLLHHQENSCIFNCIKKNYTNITSDIPAFNPNEPPNPIFKQHQGKGEGS